MPEGQGESKSWIEKAAEHVEHGAQYLDKGVKAWETIHKAEAVVKAVKEATWFKDLSAGEKAAEYYSAAKDGLNTAKESSLGKTLGKATQVLTLVEGAAQFAEGAKMVYDGKTKDGTQKILGGSYDLLTGVVPGSGIAEMAINKGLDKLYDKELGKGDHKDGHLKEVITKTANDGLEKAGNFLGDKAYDGVQAADKGLHKAGDYLGDKAYEGVQKAKEVEHKAVDTAHKLEDKAVDTAHKLEDKAVAGYHDAKDTVSNGWAALKEAVAHPADTYQKLAAAAPQSVEVARAGPDR